MSWKYSAYLPLGPLEVRGFDVRPAVVLRWELWEFLDELFLLTTTRHPYVGHELEGREQVPAPPASGPTEEWLEAITAAVVSAHDAIRDELLARSMDALEVLRVLA